jgi:hypothetical protein
MADEYRIRLTEDGDVSSEREASDAERESKIQQIIEMINDVDTPPGPIKRLIAAELANLSRLMIRYGNDVSILEGMKIKALETQVKTLRELGKELMEADVIGKKDFLNLDGKKFRYAIDEFREGAKEAMRSAKLDDSTINSILNHWRDIMQSKTEDIRRTIDKMDTAKN